MNYLAYHFEVKPPQPGSEILIALISDQGFDSFEQTTNGFTAYIREELASDVDFSDITFEDFTFTWRSEKIGAVNWNAEWEKNFNPVQVERLLNIRAPFHASDSAFAHEIVITPKMSFGTGHHQTTRLMCAALFETPPTGLRVLDMGCGTGILAILARQLGAAEVVGIDIDAWCVENSLENCAMNGCPEIVVHLGDAALLSGQAPFDMILANINKNILKKDLPVYASRINKGGRLLLSGFFVTDVAELRDVSAALGFQFERQSHENEWAMLQLLKN